MLEEARQPGRVFGPCKTPRGNGEIVALIEPDPVLREVYEDKIAALGYEPVGFKTCADLCNWISKGKQADLVLVDQSSLPGIRVLLLCTQPSRRRPSSLEEVILKCHFPAMT